MKKTTLIFTLFALFIFSMTFSQAPANDTCTGAFEIPNIGNTCNDILVTLDTNATDSGELPSPPCAEYQGFDLWYKLVIPATGGVTIITSISDGTIDDGGLAVYTGTCGSLQLYACTDDSNPIDTLMGKLNVAYTIGETIYIRVWAYGANQFGTFNICAEEYSPPTMASNDDCINSINLPTNSTCVNTSGSNNATNSEINDPTIPHPTPDEDCGFYAGRDVWYNIIVPSTGRFAVETSYFDNTSIEDTGMAIYSGNCDPNGLTFITCNDDFTASSLFSRIELSDRTPNETLFVRVYSWGNEELGTFNICATELPSLDVQNLQSNEFKMFPNPTSDFINIKLGIDIGDLEVNIYDLQGKKVLHNKYKTPNNQFQVPLYSLKPGMYFISLISGYNNWTEKLIIQ